jgi:hypothetical protein
LLEEAELERMGVISQVWHVLITALDSEDWHRRAWATDKILSSYIARDSPFAPARRGAGVDESAGPPRVIEYRWRTDDDDKRDAEAAEAERHRDEGEHAVEIGWGGDRKIVEHEAEPEPSNKG